MKIKNNIGSEDVNLVMTNALESFQTYKNVPGKERASFLNHIADEIEKISSELVKIAGEETNLSQARLNGELKRTTIQLKMFAALLMEGSWVEAAIDTADKTRTPAKSDIRKMLQPVGPVIVFGASNFPFAFSTAGGDTASALASGSTIVIKGHSAHSKTSELVFTAIQKAIRTSKMPEYTVQHVLGPGNSIGKALVLHPAAAGVGFTGSFLAGKALVEYASSRDVPIPVFAEMSSINPAVFLPDALDKHAVALSNTFAGSITLGVGQFCTNPGLLIMLESNKTDHFLALLSEEIYKVFPQKMLHTGIAQSYSKNANRMLEQKGVKVITHASEHVEDLLAHPILAKVKANEFLINPILQEEVFGPFSLIVVCNNKNELKLVLSQLKGQLTTTILATEEDIRLHRDIIDMQTALAGRIILNEVPTGVEVCASMVHGGPYPATTDSRFTSVGTTAIKRWVRPVCLQGFTDALLPDSLKDANPLGIWRLINNEFTKGPAN